MSASSELIFADLYKIILYRICSLKMLMTGSKKTIGRLKRVAANGMQKKHVCDVWIRGLLKIWLVRHRNLEY